MFMVGGGILTHGLPFAHHGIEAAAAAIEPLPVLGGVLSAIAPTILNALFGVVAGAVVLAGVALAQRILAAFRK
jgi:predicted DNA repair protein MutK